MLMLNYSDYYEASATEFKVKLKYSFGKFQQKLPFVLNDEELITTIASIGYMQYIT